MMKVSSWMKADIFFLPACLGKRNKPGIFLEKGTPMPEIKYTEAEIIKKTGYTPQMIRYLRNGRKAGKYKYDPVLFEGTHWKKFGGGVGYTEAALKLLKERRLLRPVE
jgi:hypothetical protein